jgi:uncharacterized membrane-anchored protein YitT (DUF2179 family)
MKNVTYPSPKRNHLKSTALVVMSALLGAMAIKIFIENGNLFPGGFAGISVLIQRLSLRYFNISIPFGVLYLLLNVYPTFLVYHFVGKWFTRYSVLQIALVSLFVEIIPVIKITDDILLIAVFGGIFSGVAASLSLMANASGGGSDFIALFISHKTNTQSWNYILAGNAVILSIAGMLFSWEVALYSIIFQYVSTVIVSNLYQRYKLMSIRMFTNKPDELTEAILSKTRHGITKIWGEGGYSKKEVCMLYMVVNTYEVNQVVEIAQTVDSKVFIDISKTDKVIGNYYRIPLD